jgi:hypothetical protein
MYEKLRVEEQDQFKKLLLKYEPSICIWYSIKPISPQWMDPNFKVVHAGSRANTILSSLEQQLQ